VRVQFELLAPGMQHAEETNLCTEVSRITSNFEKSFGTGAEQEIVNDLLVLQHQRGQPTRQCEDHVQVARRKKFSLTRSDLRPLFREKWVVYLKPPFGGPEYVLQYLGRYTHRVAISNHRLVSFADGQVTFRWRDSADGNKQKLLPLSVNEFLTRFLLHILPQGFVRIRNFGFLASRKRTTLLPLCLQLLDATQEPPAQEHASSTEDTPGLYRCPNCGGPMKVIERLTAAEIQLRSPPVVTAAA
jgi:Putative transposase